MHIISSLDIYCALSFEMIASCHMRYEVALLYIVPYRIAVSHDLLLQSPSSSYLSSL